MTSSNSVVHTKLDLSDSSSYLPSNLFQPKSTFFNRKQSAPAVQQLLLRRNRLDSLSNYAKALAQLKQHLTELSLRENNFTKFPSEITALKNLTSLSLANNQLTFIESDTLSQLTNLQWLNLCNNKLTELPVDMVCCHHLRGLDLENNNFEKFPEVVFYLTRLEVLMFQKNKLQMIPANYDFPSTVHTLNLAFNQFTQIPPTLINRPPAALTHVHFSGNKLRNIHPKFLSVGYSKLVSLDLHTCQLSRCSPKFFERLSKCKDLKRLNLAINRLSEIPSEIGLLSQLQWLNLNDNIITGLPESISNLIHLVKLGLVQNRIEVLPPFIFLHMLELQKLDIRRNQLKYMPPSILALAPRQEVDIHVNLAVPHSVFHTLSTPICPTTMQGGILEQGCFDSHPYGGSLRTLLFYENPTIEHVDGILCDFGEDIHNPESVQAMSISSIFSIIQSNSFPHKSKAALRQALIPTEKEKGIVYCNHPKFRRSDNPMPNMMSEIDDEESNSLNDDGMFGMEDEERDAIRSETQRLLTQVLPLRELTLRTHLSSSHDTLLKQQHAVIRQKRLDQTPEKSYLFIKSILPSSIVPFMMQQETIQEARQCDYCSGWYTHSKFQIGYLARLCNNRLQIPIRFNLCSIDCSIDAVIQLYQSTMDWHTRQSLAHIDATLLLPSQPQQVQQRQQPREIERSSTATYWNVSLVRSPTTSLNRGSTHRTLGTEQDNDEEENDSPTGTNGSTLTATSASSSSTTLSSSESNLSTRQSSLARTITNRVSQFAATLFVGGGNHSDNEHPDLTTTSSPSSSSSESTTIETSSTTVNHSNILPFVFPNVNLGITTHIAEQEPPSIVSVTSRILEGRLQTERTQPQLRLAAPTPNPTAFNHLPRDAIRLEKF